MNCIICQSSKTFFYHQFDNYQTVFDVQKCQNCGCLFQKNIEDYSKYYTKEYYLGNSEYSYYDERKYFQYNKYVWKERLHNIRKFISKGNLLDVGCAFGGFLQVAIQYYRSYGLDISEYAVEKGMQWARNKKISNSFLSLYQGNLLDIPKVIKNENFDVVTLIEVAEHLPNPRDAFQKIFNLMNSPGLLVIQTANFEGEQAIKEGKNYNYFMPGHLVYYTASALKKMLSEIGYKKFIEYIPVDFSLLAKLKKSRGYFKNIIEYQKWFNMSWYHLKSKIKTKKGRNRTSSYVLYAFK